MSQIKYNLFSFQTLIFMIAIFMAKFCDNIIVIISFLVPGNQILVLSPKIAYNSVTDEFSIIVTPYVTFFDNYVSYYRS